MMIAAIRCQDLKLVGNKQHVYEILRFFKRFTLKINKRKFLNFFFTSLSGLGRPLAAGQYISSYDVRLSQRGRLGGEQKHASHEKKNWLLLLLLQIVNKTTRGPNIKWTVACFRPQVKYAQYNKQENLWT